MGGRGTDCPGHPSSRPLLQFRSFLQHTMGWMLDSAFISLSPITAALLFQPGCNTLRRKSTCLNPFFESPQCLASILLHTQKIHNRYVQIAAVLKLEFWPSGSQFRVPPNITQSFFINRMSFFLMEVKYVFEIAQFGFAQQRNSSRVKRTEQTTMIEKLSADTGSDQWNIGIYEEQFQLPSEVMMKK